MCCSYREGQLEEALDVLSENELAMRVPPAGEVDDGDPDRIVTQIYSIRGEEADEILRKTLTADTLNLRLSKEGRGADLDVDVLTANLTHAGSDAKMLECIGSR